MAAQSAASQEELSSVRKYNDVSASPL
jgi:hypothetical protein